MRSLKSTRCGEVNIPVFNPAHSKTERKKAETEAEVLEQAAEKTVGAEEIVSESVEAEPAEMSENQNEGNEKVSSGRMEFV